MVQIIADPGNGHLWNAWKRTMSDIAPNESNKPRGMNFWRREWPYVTMLALVFGGIAITNLSPLTSATHWQVLTVLFGLIAIVTEWGRLSDGRKRWRLVWTQVLHWGTLLLAMRMLLLSNVDKMLSSNAVGLEVLGLLALGTILAGIHAGAWEIGIVGIVLALAVPAIAWLEQATLLLLLAAIIGVCLIGAFVWYRYR
jgi:hypothetical protein